MPRPPKVSPHNQSYRSRGETLAGDLRSAILRCLSSDLYEDAPLDEVAEACECSPRLVQQVLDDMRLRRTLVHARLVSEQLGLGMEENLAGVIHLALEALYAGGVPEARGPEGWVFGANAAQRRSRDGWRSASSVPESATMWAPRSRLRDEL